MNITLFTSTNCAYCPIAKNQLEAKNIEYSHVNIDDSPELASEHEIMSVPSIVDENNQVYRGLQECLRKIDEI